MELFHILTSSFCFLLSLPLIMRVPTVSGSAVTPQNCTTTAPSSTTCQAMVGYVPANNLHLSGIASLFSLNYTSILGPNDFNLSVPGVESVVVPGGKVYMIPQTCGCVNGTRAVISTNYTVQSGDTLSTIAQQYYSSLVTYEQIGIANNIANVNLIKPGQSFLIPIPCGCPTSITGSDEVLLSYQIQTGDTLSSIAGKYNTTTVSQLTQLNSLSNSSILTASDVLFVPFPVCQAANFSKNALDKNLTVVEGTYELTANNCVQCRCNNGTLHCTPTPSSFGASCSNMTCPSSTLTLGNSTASQASSGCSVQSCVYMGYNESGIISKLETEVDPTCPAPPPPESLYNPPKGLVASPLSSPTVTSSSSTPPPSSIASTPPPPSSIASTPSSPTTSSKPNSASLLAGDHFLPAWWQLLILGLCLWVPSLAL